MRIPMLQGLGDDLSELPIASGGGITQLPFDTGGGGSSLDFSQLPVASGGGITQLPFNVGSGGGFSLPSLPLSLLPVQGAPSQQTLAIRAAATNPVLPGGTSSYLVIGAVVIVGLFFLGAVARK